MQADTDGATALHIAAQKGHAEVVKLLLDNNANVNAIYTAYGATALFVAAQNCHKNKTMLT